MLVCENLLLCPTCEGNPELIVYEIGSLYTLRCKNCQLQYGEIVDPHMNDDGYPSDETYIRICENWNAGVSKQKQINNVKPIFIEK